MKNLFTKSTIQRFKSERSVVRDVTGEILENMAEASSEASWKNDPVGSGLKNTQQLDIDWSKLENHVFFSSAESKVNLAFDEIINGYPFDGTSIEKSAFRSSIGGYTKYLFDRINANKGYFKFDGTVYLSIEDLTGKLAPELADSVGETVTTKHVDLSGVTLEFWIYVPTAVSTTQQMIYQKSDTTVNPAVEGISVFRSGITPGAASSPATYGVTFLISSDKYKSIAHTIPDIECDKWHHVAFTYHRATSERVSAYLDGFLNSSTLNHQAELDDITLGSIDINIGKGSRHTTYNPNSEAGVLTTTIPGIFVGLLDEVRVWLGVRTIEEIKRSMHKNVSASEKLLLCYRFNEPSFTGSPYQASGVVLDFSGNSLHTLITDWNGVYDPKSKLQDSSGDDIATPLLLESDEENRILFPDWPATRALQEKLILDANHYDRNNPNLITKLVPQHYFEQALEKQGTGQSLEDPQQVSYQNIQHPIPGHGTMPSRVVIFSFLMIWANFFDDIKLWLDSFSTINKVSYDAHNQVPAQVITFLEDFYGINLPNPYSNEDISRFQYGENVTNELGKGVPLSKTLDQLWRRILINLPYIIRSRGTIAGIKALMNTIGIEPDTVFRFKEYGGNLTKKLESKRIRRRRTSKYIDLKDVGYIESSPLWAWRHEPGLPDSGGAPVAQEILFQSGDITWVKPGKGPKPTLYTSGSWSWEGRYKLLPTETTASLFRIEKGNDILANLVAMRTKDNNGTVDFNLKLFLDGHKNSSSPIQVSLPGVNLWDSRNWYISVINEFGATNNKITLQCIRTVENYIVENHSGSFEYSKDSAASTLNGTTNNYNPNIPLFQTDDSNAPTQDSVKWYVGESTKSYNSAYNQYDSSLKNTNGTKTSYSGSISHMRFWSKALTDSEKIDHAFNPFSVSTDNPAKSFAFPNQPILQLVGGANVEIPLGKYSGNYDGTLPDGSWERLRQSFENLQEDPTPAQIAAEEFLLIDTTQNNDTATVYGDLSGIKKENMMYTITSVDFDDNSTDNKVRIRSFSDKQTAKEAHVHHGTLTNLPMEVGLDDRRFSIESSIIHGLNEDISNVIGDSRILNEYLGAPELEYAVDYPDLRKLNDVYFRRVVRSIDYNVMIEFQRWFNNNFASIVEQFIPYTADFLGINFIVESHMLERHKVEYKQGDVHVDIRDRRAFSQEPLFIGTIRSEIT